MDANKNTFWEWEKVFHQVKGYETGQDVIDFLEEKECEVFFANMKEVAYLDDNKIWINDLLDIESKKLVILHEFSHILLKDNQKDGKQQRVNFSCDTSRADQLTIAMSYKLSENKKTAINDLKESYLFKEKFFEINEFFEKKSNGVSLLETDFDKFLTNN